MEATSAFIDTAAILDALGVAKFLNLGWSGGHNSIVRHLPEIISALIASGRPAQS
jgi:hypothetical protein